MGREKSADGPLAGGGVGNLVAGGHKACTECALARVGGRCPVCKAKVKKIRRMFR